jgi:hypothetical protein
MISTGWAQLIVRAQFHIYLYTTNNVIYLDVFMVLFININLMQNKMGSFIDCNVRKNKKLRTVCDCVIFL